MMRPSVESRSRIIGCHANCIYIVKFGDCKKTGYNRPPETAFRPLFYTSLGADQNRFTIKSVTSIISLCRAYGTSAAKVEGHEIHSYHLSSIGHFRASPLTRSGPDTAFARPDTNPPSIRHALVPRRNRHVSRPGKHASGPNRRAAPARPAHRNRPRPATRPRPTRPCPTARPTRRRKKPKKKKHHHAKFSPLPRRPTPMQ